MIEREMLPEDEGIPDPGNIGGTLKKSGYSHTKLQRTPLGEKIVVYASRPGLVVGRQGQNIRRMTADLKDRFGLRIPRLRWERSRTSTSTRISSRDDCISLERFGTQRFKGIMHKTMGNVMEAGALGVEIVLS
jgi:small subunit ribosomal protein S3